MGAFESETKRVIEQGGFIQIAEDLLQQAHDPTKGIEECMVAAQSVAQGLSDITAGHLEVQPPLTEEQLTHYRKDSELIISLGQKSVKALQKTEKRSIRSGPKRSSGTSRPAFFGTGSDVKKY